MIYETFISCFAASTLQNASLFWIKPIIKTQYVKGTSLSETVQLLRDTKDPIRFYRGIIPNVLKASIGRTSDISIYRYIDNKYGNNKQISSFVSGTLSSVVKVVIMPLDTLSNIYQVHGKEARKHIQGNLYRGTLAHGSIHAISSSLWLMGFSNLKDLDYFSNKNLNYLSTGFICSGMTDIVVNPIRVIKTNRQAFSNSYLEIIKNIQYTSGFYRGFSTKLFLNAVNGALFVLFWQNLEQFMVMNKRE